MMLSVMVVGAGAAFSDQSKIKNTEAVDACTALNIIGGYPDGSFKPEGNITRAEVTKMICVALNGGKNPAVSTNTTPTFSDVRNNANAAWAEGYIESCYAQGIISGVGGGKFAPAGNVTGTQLAKMLLVALGYNATTEKFTGNAWATNVNIVATQKGLYKDLETMDVSAALTRDNAAKMIWNALEAIEVEYNYTLIGNNGNLSSNVTVKDKLNPNSAKDDGDGYMSLLEDKYGATTKKGILTAVGHTTKGYTATISTAFGGTKVVDLSKMTQNPTDLVGKAVKALYKAKDDVYGIYVDNSNTMTVVTASINDIDTDSVSATKDKVKVNDVEYKVESNTNAIPVYTTLGGRLTYVESQTTKDATLDNLLNKGLATTGSNIVFIDNTGNEKIDVAVVTPVNVYKVNYVSSDSVTCIKPEESTQNITTTWTKDKDDCNLYDGIAKGDYVSIIDKGYVAEDEYQVSKLPVVTGTVNGTKTGEVRIDNTWYKTTYVNTSFKMGNRVSVVALNGVIYATTTTEGVSASDYLVVEEVQMDWGDVVAKVILADGTEKKVTVSKLYAYDNSTNKKKWDYVKVSSKDQISKGLYAYKVVDEKYQLIDVTDASTSAESSSTFNVKNTLGYDVMNNANPAAGAYNNKKLNGNPVDASALVFVYDTKEGEYKVVKGSHVTDWKDSAVTTTAAVTLSNKSGGYNYVKVAYVAINEDPGVTSDKLYGYIANDPYASQLSNGDSAMEFDLFDGTKTASVLDKNNTTDLKKGDIVEYTVAGDGVIKVKDVKFSVGDSATNRYSTAAKQIAGMNGNGGVDTVLKFDSIDSTDEYVITKDTVILYINAKDNKGVTGGSVTVADMDANDTLLGNKNALVQAKSTKNSDGYYEVELLVVDSNNNLNKQ